MRTFVSNAVLTIVSIAINNRAKVQDMPNIFQVTANVSSYSYIRRRRSSQYVMSS